MAHVTARMHDLPPEPEAPAAPDHLSLVADMSRDFAESHDLDEALARGLDRIANKLDAEGASLFVLDESRDDLVCRACTGPVDIQGLRLDRGAGIVGRTVRLGTPQLVTDTSDDPDFLSRVDSVTGLTTQSVLAAPLRVQATTYGAVELINKRGRGNFNEDDARSLEALGVAAGLALVNARHAEAMAQQAALRRELSLAAEIQHSFLPHRRPAAFPVHGQNRAAREVSGDFFDIVETHGGRRIWFALGDVAGKGINAALLMARTTSLFRYLVKSRSEPSEVLSAINSELHETSALGFFVTMVCGLYDTRTQTVHLANAGNEAVLELRGPAPGTATWHGAQTPPLGLIDDLYAAGGTHNVRIPMAGRRLYLFTDGLSETRGDDGRFLGAEGVAALVQAAEQAALDGPTTVDSVLARLAPGEAAPADDLTLVRVAGPAS
jgi:sigma-B regulation protein RsbU (phosphoserine phosphatase)